MRNVAVGIIRNNNKYFCAQRSEDKQLAFKWEFPGGKFEKGETGEEALKRELKEELGINIVNIQYIDHYSYDHGFGEYDLHFYFCDISEESKINLKEHLNYGWYTIEEIEKLDFLESGKRIIKKLKGKEIENGR